MKRLFYMSKYLVVTATKYTYNLHGNNKQQTMHQIVFIDEGR